MVGDTNNTVGLANLYPGARGISTSTGSEADSIGVQTEHVSMLSDVERSFSTGIVLGKPVTAYIAILFVVGLIMFLATWFKTPEHPAANVKFSIYNIVAVTLLGVLGGAGLKTLAAKYSNKLGPVATVILAS